jgi:hypothetical protein
MPLTPAFPHLKAPPRVTPPEAPTRLIQGQDPNLPPGVLMHLNPQTFPAGLPRNNPAEVPCG